ncbi:MAG TPA: hypothetical protein VFE42_36410 [Chloroflexota bacterium]|nr:hypothetical protein [Chloroflexota bacterium]
MRRVRAWAIALFMTLFGTHLDTHTSLGASPSTPDVTITLLQAEPVPLIGPGDPSYQSLLVRVRLTYLGTDVLWVGASDFRIVDASGLTYTPQTIQGRDALTSREIVGPRANYTGWLLFDIPKGLAPLQVGFRLSKSNKSETVPLVSTKPFTPVASPLWLYALAARPALQQYLDDAALVAGYIRLQVERVYLETPSLDLSALDRSLVRRSLQQLIADRGALDEVAVKDDLGRRLRAQADAVCRSMESDLSALLDMQPSGDASTWRATFDEHDRALADLYEHWPGNVMLGS